MHREGEPDVGQRAGCDEGRLRSSAKLLREVLDRVLGLRGAGGGREIGAVEPGLAVHVGRHVPGTQERRVRPGKDRDVAAARQLQHPQRVRRRLVERLIARDGGHSDELDLG